MSFDTRPEKQIPVAFTIFVRDKSKIMIKNYMRKHFPIQKISLLLIIIAVFLSGCGVIGGALGGDLTYIVDGFRVEL